MSDGRTRDAFVAAVLDALTNTCGEAFARRITQDILNGLPGGRLDQSGPLTTKNVHDAIVALARIGIEIVGEDAKIAPDWTRDVRGHA